MRIENGREHFYQWDTNQRLLVEDNDVIEVHFYNAISTNALVCAVYEDSGNRVVNVPNILLQEHFDIKACGCCAECVRVAEIFTVETRKKPDDYIYTETEIKRYEDLESRIEYLEKNGTGTGGGVGIESVIQTDKDGGYNIVNFTDGNNLKVKNGETGKAGKQGESIRITSIAETQEGNTVNFSDGNTMFVANGSGVYVGTETPNNNANVWINPNGKSYLPIASSETLGGVKIGEGLEIAEDGTLSASTEGVYELIETITVQEEASRIERNQEPNGAKYNFTKIYVDIKTPAGEAQKTGVISLNADSGVVPVAYLQKLIETNTDGAWGKVYAHIDGNVLRSSCACGINGESQLVWGNAISYMRGFGEVGHTNIHFLQISMLSANFPIGSKIEIWGVRA